LTAALSIDGDKSYPHRLNLAKGIGNFAGPAVVVKYSSGRLCVARSANTVKFIFGTMCAFTSTWLTDLGTFVEFEAVLSSEEDETQAPDRLNQLCHELAIMPADHIASSYAELMGL
jgi:hypothetical protein